MVVYQAERERKDLQAGQVPTLSSSSILFNRIDCEIATDMEGSIAMFPIEYKGESVLLNPQYMNIGESYPFFFLGHQLVATKRRDETIDFYYLE